MINFFIINFLSLILFVNTTYANTEQINLNLLENRVNQISQNIRCLVCRNQTIESSNSEFAIDIKQMIKEKLLEGKNEDYIFKYLKSRYGDYILFDPPFQLNTLMLWLLPFLCLFLGITFFAFKHLKIKKK